MTDRPTGENELETEELDWLDTSDVPLEVLTGTVVSQQANYYYVQSGTEEYACHIKGKLKKSGETPYVGDQVVIHLEPLAPGEKLAPQRAGSLALPEKEGEEPAVRKGFIDTIAPRKNILKRPTIANVDQLLLVFAAAQPEFNPYLLDKFLVLSAHENFEVVIVINKRDLLSREELEGHVEAYRQLGYHIVTTQAAAGEVSELMPLLAHKVSVLAGPSGVGKSSLLNGIQPGLELRTLEVSSKLQRGRHTTRHAALYPIETVEGALLADTPGFSALDLDLLDPPELAWLFPEMKTHIPDCRLPSCLHREEPDCAVKERAQLSPVRYESYLRLLDELLEMKKDVSDRSLKVEDATKTQKGQKGQEKRLVKVDAADREPDRRTMKQKLHHLLGEVDDWKADDEELDLEEFSEFDDEDPENYE